MFFEYDKIKLETLSQGVSRKILAHDEKLMTVEVRFEKGSIGEAHSHDEHDQIVYILEGAFEFTLEDKKYVCHKGDSLYIKPHTMHGTICLEAGKLLDIFTPQRKDFL